MVTKSLNRPRRVSFDHHFELMSERLSRFVDRTAKAASELEKRFGWILSNKHVGLGAIIALTAIMGGLMYMAITMH